MAYLLKSLVWEAVLGSVGFVSGSRRRLTGALCSAGSHKHRTVSLTLVLPLLTRDAPKARDAFGNSSLYTDGVYPTPSSYIIPSSEVLT